MCICTGALLITGIISSTVLIFNNNNTKATSSNDSSNTIGRKGVFEDSSLVYPSTSSLVVDSVENSYNAISTIPNEIEILPDGDYTESNNNSTDINTIELKSKEELLIKEIENYIENYTSSTETLCELDDAYLSSFNRIGNYTVEEDREIVTYLQGIDSSSDINMLESDQCYRITVLVNDHENYNISNVAIPKNSYIRLKYIKEEDGMLRRLKEKVSRGYRRILGIVDEEEYVELKEGEGILKMEFMPGKKNSKSVELDVVIDTGHETYVQNYIYKINYPLVMTTNSDINTIVEELDDSSDDALSDSTLVDSVINEAYLSDVNEYDEENLFVENPNDNNSNLTETENLNVNLILNGNEELQMTNNEDLDFINEEEDLDTNGNNNGEDDDSVNEVAIYSNNNRNSYVPIILSCCSVLGLSAMAYFIFSNNKFNLTQHILNFTRPKISNSSSSSVADILPKLDRKDSNFQFKIQESRNFSISRIDLDSAAGCSSSQYASQKEKAFTGFKGVYFPFKNVITEFCIGLSGNMFDLSKNFLSKIKINWNYNDAFDKNKRNFKGHNKIYPVSMEIG